MCILCSPRKLQENLHNPGCCCDFIAMPPDVLIPSMGTVDVGVYALATAIRQCANGLELPKVHQFNERTPAWKSVLVSSLLVRCR